MISRLFLDEGVALRIVALLLAALMMSACAGSPPSLPKPSLSPDELLARRTSGLDAANYKDGQFWLNSDKAMRDFVELSTQYADKDQVPIELLRALREEWSRLNYERSANLTASEAFRAQRANCLSLTEVVISLMRHAGVRAQFQRVETITEWDLDGDSAVGSLHINAVIFIRGRQFEVDWLARRTQDGYERKFILSDDEALAEWHSNIGTEALLRDEYPLAFAELSRALSLAPDAAHIWVNLGVLYRRLGMNLAAESAWLIALERKPRQLQAMSNLQALFAVSGRQELAAGLNSWIANYRTRNPFYHYLRAQEAERAGRLSEALRHIRKAKSMHEDARFDALQARVRDNVRSSEET
ncbi:MAG: tetratricopeptide (TPR) repeat protein [Bermanella sp.]